MSGMSGGAQGWAQGEYIQKAARIEERDYKMAAEQIELEQIQREADRKERLAKSMATSTAMAGASGVAALEGSPLSVLKESVAQEKQATQRDKYMSDLKAMTARHRGRLGVYASKVQANAAHKAGRSQTFGSLFGGGMAMAGGGTPQTPQTGGYSMQGTGTASNYSGYA